MATDPRIVADRAARAELRAAVDDLHAAEIAAGERRPNRVWLLLPLAATILLIVAAVGIVRWERAADDPSDEAFRSAAVEHVSLLLSPDYRNPDRVRRILEGATGGFHDEFAQSADAYTTFVRSQGTVARGVVERLVGPSLVRALLARRLAELDANGPAK